MMTRTVLEKLPKGVRDQIERLREYSLDEPRVRRIARASYVKALRDVGIINERERQVLFIYTTIEKGE